MLKGVIPKLSKPPMSKPVSKLAQADYTEQLQPALPPLVSKPIVGSSSTTLYKTVDGKKVEVSGTGNSESVTLNKGVFVEKPGFSFIVEGGRTINLGNFESARISVGITVPCDPHTLAESYEWATNWISERIEAAVKEAKGE